MASHLHSEPKHCRSWKSCQIPSEQFKHLRSSQGFWILSNNVRSSKILPNPFKSCQILSEHLRSTHGLWVLSGACHSLLKSFQHSRSISTPIRSPHRISLPLRISKIDSNRLKSSRSLSHPLGSCQILPELSQSFHKLSGHVRFALGRWILSGHCRSTQVPSNAINLWITSD